ncbi:MAG TPA: glycosidase-like protein, partial [Polyangia bacterium]|nr:glycosidase-like protein [Polyangia bacterium]
MPPVTVVRSGQRLLPDPRRVIAKPYLPGEDGATGGDSRTGLLLQRVLAIPEAEVPGLLAGITADFSGRHRAFEETLHRHFELVAGHLPPDAALTPERRALVGAYFTHEYSVEGAALFN